MKKSKFINVKWSWYVTFQHHNHHLSVSLAQPQLANPTEIPAEVKATTASTMVVCVCLSVCVIDKDSVPN